MQTGAPTVENSMEVLQKTKDGALAGVAQWLSAGLRIKGLPAQFPVRAHTSLGCGPGPQWGACERQPPIDVSLPLFFLPFPSLKNK